MQGSDEIRVTFSVTGFRSYFIIISGHHSNHMWGSDWGLKRHKVKGKNACALWFFVYGVWKEELTCHKVSYCFCWVSRGKTNHIHYYYLMKINVVYLVSYFRWIQIRINSKRKNYCTFTSVGQVLYSTITAITASLRAVAIMDCRKAFIDPAAHLFKPSLTHTVPRREVSISQVWFIMVVLAAACALHSAEEYIDWL